MLRSVVITLVVLSAMSSIAAAQPYVDDAYRRGVGPAAYGIMILKESAAEEAIRVDKYQREVVKEQRRTYAVNEEKKVAAHKANYEKVLERISSNPRVGDVLKGDALNALMEKLNQANLERSVYDYRPVPIPIESVRKIRFLIAREGITFSMQRLSIQGDRKLPVVLGGDEFALERMRYQRAFDNALDQSFEGRISVEAITAVEKAIEAFHARLRTLPIQGDEKLFTPANQTLIELKNLAQALKSQNFQRVLGELEAYSGTNVNDLRIFIQKHGLQFDVADSVEERGLYPELYKLLLEQAITVNVKVDDSKK